MMQKVRDASNQSDFNFGSNYNFQGIVIFGGIAI